MASIGDLLHTASALMAACTRNVARATKRLRRRRAGASSGKIQRSTPARKKKASAIFIGGGPVRCYIIFVRSSKKVASERSEEDNYGAGAGSEAEEDAAVWQRTILMGEKCEPLNFPGVIYYDNAGRQLKEVPTPRTPRTPQRGELPPLDHFAFNLQEIDEKH